MTRQELTGLPQAVQTSLQAGRISLDEAETLRGVFIRDGERSGTNTLKHFEKLHSIQPYFELTHRGFNLGGFSYSAKLTSREDKQKIAIALQEPWRSWSLI